MSGSNGYIEAKPIKSVKDVKARRALPALCEEYREQCEIEKDAKAIKKELMEEIAAHAKRARITKVDGSGWRLAKRQTTRRSISAQKLVEQGVKPATIERATVETESTYFQVLARVEDLG